MGGNQAAIEFKPVAQWTWRTESTAIFSIGLIATLPLLIVQIAALWSMPYMRFFPLAWLCFAYFIWEVPKYGFAADGLRRKAAVIFTGLGLVLAVIGAVAISPNLMQLAAILVLFGWVQLWLGVATFTRLAAISSLLLITWPLPGALYGRILDKIESTAATMTSHVLDFLSIPHCLAYGNLDIRNLRVDLSLLSSSYDSVYTLLFLAVLLSVALYRPLFLSLMTVLTVPVIAWLGSVAKPLLAVWGSEGFGDDWTAGNSLILLRVGVFVSECGLVFLVFMAFSIMFEPIMVDRAEQINRGVHGIYNRVMVWPLNFAATISHEERPYFEDEVTPEGVGFTKPQQVVRTGPSLSATKVATDPWLGSRWAIGLVAMGLVAFVCGLVAVLLPTTKKLTLPEYSESQLADFGSAQSLANSNAPESLGGIRPLKSGEKENSHVLAWEYASDRGVAEFSVVFPTRGFHKEFQGAPGWRVSGAPRRFTSSDWPGYEVEFVKESGKKAYGWFTAFDEHGGAYAPTKSMFGRIRDRFTTSIFGRLLGISNETVTFQTMLFLDSNESLTERAKSDLQSKCIEFTQAAAKKIVGVQP